MDDRSYLHDNEQLLALMHPSVTVLFAAIGRGVVEGIVIGFLLCVLMFIGAFFGDISLALWVYIPLLIVCALLICWRRWALWKRSMLRVTTDRILLQYPSNSLFALPMKTIKWNQYQESFTKGGVIGAIFGAKKICFRYGTADGQNLSCFPSVRYASDLKHYLDKVDSAVRQNRLSEVRPFVAKPKGRRD